MSILLVLVMFILPYALSSHRKRERESPNYSLSAIAASVGILILLMGAALKLVYL
jgi:hypothetical protein